MKAVMLLSQTDLCIKTHAEDEMCKHRLQHCGVRLSAMRFRACIKEGES